MARDTHVTPYIYVKFYGAWLNVADQVLESGRKSNNGIVLRVNPDDQLQLQNEFCAGRRLLHKYNRSESYTVHLNLNYLDTF